MPALASCRVSSLQSAWTPTLRSAERETTHTTLPTRPGLKEEAEQLVVGERAGLVGGPIVCDDHMRVRGGVYEWWDLGECVNMACGLSVATGGKWTVARCGCSNESRVRC